jgi:hypothetical protein
LLITTLFVVQMEVHLPCIQIKAYYGRVNLWRYGMIYRGFTQTETEDGAAAALPGLVEAFAESEENAKRAIVAYLFLAIERKPDERLLQLFDELFLARGGEAEAYSLAKGYGDFTDDRDAVIRMCDAYLGSAEDSDERYKLAVEAIRGAEQGMFSHPAMALYMPVKKLWNSQCNREQGTSGSYGFLSVNIALPVYNLVLDGMRAGIYEGNRKKMARFMVRFTKRDKTVFAELEEVARKMLALEERVAGVKQTGATETCEHISARLAALQAEELPVKKQLENLLRRDLFAEHEPEVAAETEAEEYEEAGPAQRIVDSVADGICTGIETVTDVICAPFEWLTEKMMGLACGRLLLSRAGRRYTACFGICAV